LRDALLHRTVPSLSAALDDARAAKMSGPLVDQVRVRVRLGLRVGLS
jgi:hypothetical protein